MNKSSLVWQGTLALLILGLAVDRYVTDRHVKELEHEYRVVAAAAAEARADAEAAARSRAQNVSAGPSGELAVPKPVAVPHSAPAPTVDASSDAPPRATPEPPPEPRAAPEPEDQVAHVDAVFSTQVADVAWSRAAETKLTAALSRLAEQGARVREVECRSTLCKATVDHPSEEGLQTFVDHAFTQANYWSGAMLSWRDPNGPKGSWSNVMYFSKDTAEMPTLSD